MTALAFEVTLNSGSLINGITVSVGAGVIFLIAGYVWSKRYKGLNAFKIKIRDGAFNRPKVGPAKYSLGKNSIYLIVDCGQAYEFDWVNIKLVNRRRKWFLERDEVDTKRITMTSADHARGPDFPACSPGPESPLIGWDLRFNPPFKRKSGESLFLIIEVEANDRWKGYLRFEAYVPQGYRATTFQQVEFR